VLSQVKFQHKARCPISIYEDFFQAPVVFEAEFNTLICHRKIPDWTNKKSHLETRKSIEWHFSCLRHELGKSDTDELADIREAIKYNAIKGDYTVSGLAQRLAVSVRGLQRHLSVADVNASTLLDEARYARALELLANERMSIDEVADQLGFNNERSFRRAFQRWSEETPAQVRQRIKQ